MQLTGLLWLTLLAAAVGEETPLINKDLMPSENTNERSINSPETETITLRKACVDGRSDLWRTEEGKLCKLVPIENVSEADKIPDLSIIKLQESPPIVTPLNLQHPSIKLSNEVEKNGNRKGRTFWPFTNWFYDPMYGYNDYGPMYDYPPPPPPSYYYPPQPPSMYYPPPW